MKPSNTNTEPKHANAASGWLEAHVPAEDAPLLARQGFVSRSRLRSGSMCHKLRYRNAQGRQQVRYLGVDPSLAAAVADELARRQFRRRRHRQLRSALRRAGQALRASKRRLAPMLAAEGWRYHGYALRRFSDGVPSDVSLPDSSVNLDNLNATEGK